MPDKPPTFRPYGAAERSAQAAQAYAAERDDRAPWRGWYKLRIWCHPRDGLRARQLAKQPLCEPCLAATPPRYTPATVVHHREPHRGVWALFVDPAKLASACKPCHDGELQSQERRAR